MLFSAYAPLGITWWIVLVEDSKAARTALTGAIEMAGMGPFALLWIGTTTFLMQAKANGVLNLANPAVWVWGIMYPIINILLIILHYHLSPPMYAWLAIAPIASNKIDNMKAWSMPPKMKKAAIEKDADRDNTIVFEPSALDYSEA